MTEKERHPDLVGIELPDPEDAARRVRIRRIKRRLKAGVSLVIAAAAGTFLACTPRGSTDNRPTPGPNPSTGDSSNLPAAGPDAGTVQDAAKSQDAADAAKGQDAAKSRDAAVDRTEHQKGMPVPDNLLE